MSHVALILWLSTGITGLSRLTSYLPEIKPRFILLRAFPGAAWAAAAAARPGLTAGLAAAAACMPV